MRSQRDLSAQMRGRESSGVSSPDSCTLHCIICCTRLHRWLLTCARWLWLWLSGQPRDDLPPGGSICSPGCLPSRSSSLHSLPVNSRHRASTAGCARVCDGGARSRCAIIHGAASDANDGSRTGDQARIWCRCTQLSIRVQVISQRTCKLMIKRKQHANPLRPETDAYLEIRPDEL